MLNTLQLGLITAALTTPARHSLRLPARMPRLVRQPRALFSLWLIFVLPSYLIATGFQILLGWPALRGSLVQHLLISAPGIVLLLGLKGLPFCVLAARTGWRAIGGEIGDAARVHIADAGAAAAAAPAAAADRVRGVRHRLRRGHPGFGVAASSAHRSTCR